MKNRVANSSLTKIRAMVLASFILCVVFIFSALYFLFAGNDLLGWFCFAVGGIFSSLTQEFGAKMVDRHGTGKLFKYILPLSVAVFGLFIGYNGHILFGIICFAISIILDVMLSFRRYSAAWPFKRAVTAGEKDGHGAGKTVDAPKES